MIKKPKLKRLWILLLIPLSFIILFIAKVNGDIAEAVFARGLYYYLSQFISMLSGLLPFSLSEILLYISLVLLFGIGIKFLIKVSKAKGRRLQILGRGLINLFCGASIFLLSFVLLCGVNYYRADFSEVCGLTVEDSTAEELAGLCFQLAQRANEAREGYTLVDENGVLKLESVSSTANKAKEAMEALGLRYDVLERTYNAPKPILLSKYMSYTGITGIFIPFTMEANVNVDVVDYNIPADMCHELAHMAGFMKEEEANFIAYLACINSPYPEFVYSGIISAFVHSANALYDADSQRWVEVYESLGEKVLADLKANRDYWAEYKDSSLGSAVAAVSTDVNNAYLKINGQKDGVNSYGRMVDLLLAEYRENMLYSD